MKREKVFSFYYQFIIGKIRIKSIILNIAICKNKKSILIIGRKIKFKFSSIKIDVCDTKKLQASGKKTMTQQIGNKKCLLNFVKS